MNRAEMRAELAFILGVREGEADQDFQTTRLNKLLDQAYEAVVLDGRTHGKRVYFMMTQPLTWVEDSLTLVVPDYLNVKEMLQVVLMNGGEPGEPLPEGEDWFWKDRSTMQWQGTTGPSEDLTLRVTYEASAEKLAADVSEPQLVPPEHQMHIVWQAALDARGIADDQVPQYWLKKHADTRLLWVKHVSKPKPAESLDLMTSTLYADDNVLGN